MASAELAVVPDQAAAERDIIDGWVTMAASVFKLADHICDTDFVPKAYQGNAPAVAAAILTGRELGIGPMTSLRHVQVVKGVPSLSAEYKRARVLSAGHEFSILEWTNTRCKVKGRRRGSPEPPLEVTYSMDDAKLAGLLRPSQSGKPGAWQTRPRRMLFARAGSDLCDALFSDVVNGLPTAELLAEGSAEDEFAGYDEADGQEPAKPAVRTARRKTAAAGDPPRSQRQGPQAAPPRADENGAGTAPAAAGGAPSRGAQPLPPLPGEEEPHAASDQVAKEEDQPAGQDPGRHGKLVGIVWQHLRRLGYPAAAKETDEESRKRLSDVAILAGVADLGSTNDLDEDELSAVADTLARCRNVEALKVLLDAAEIEDGAS